MLCSFSLSFLLDMQNLLDNFSWSFMFLIINEQRFRRSFVYAYFQWKSDLTELYFV